MKGLFQFSFKLFLLMIAACVVSFISMMLVLSVDIGFIYKVLIGFLFIAFILILAWNNASERGANDTKNGIYYPVKGFIAGMIAMLPAIVLILFYMAVSYHGWEGNSQVLADGLYVLLYMLFLAYSPLLSVFVSYNPALGVDFAQPAIAYLNNITTPNAVSAPLFFVPVFLFVAVCGVAYIVGHKQQASLVDFIKQLKK